MKRSIHRIGAALALCVLAAPTWAQKSKAKPITADEAEYNALLKGYNSAWPKFYKLFTKGMSETSIKDLEGDKTKNPALMYLPRFQSLARRASPDATGAKALLEVMVLAASGLDAKAAASAADNLIAGYNKSPIIKQAVTLAGSMQWQLGVNKTAPILQKFVDRCTNRSDKAAAIYGLACLYTGGFGSTAPQKTQAEKLFAELSTDYSDIPAEKGKAGFLYQLEHLQIGMTAPDFEATDETGQKFKLSDYRGKVVVVDFWGFW